MNRLSIVVNNIELVLSQYDQIKVYRSDTEGGTYVEITGALTRITLNAGRLVYFYDDLLGTPTQWYKTSYYNSITTAESSLSVAQMGSTTSGKVGYTFNNYSAPPGEWGDIVTPDDIRWTYMWGIEMVADDPNQTEFTDEQIRSQILYSIADFEKFLDIDIMKKVYKTNPADTLVRSRYWRQGVDYTHEEDPYDFLPEEWRNNGFIQLRHAPVLSIERAILYSQVKTQVIDLNTNGWIRLSKQTGQLQLFPKNSMQYGPFAVGAYPWLILGCHYPEGFEVDYTTGFASADFVEDSLREVIAKWTVVKLMGVVGDGLMAGFSSQSVSLDGLSESFSSTQSPENTFFGARTRFYMDEIREWLKRNRYKYGRGPSISFVGV